MVPPRGAWRPTCQCAMSRERARGGWPARAWARYPLDLSADAAPTDSRSRASGILGKALKITQEELSLQTGISRPTIRAIERGKETAHVGLVLQLCRDLGLTVVATPPDAVDRP